MILIFNRYQISGRRGNALLLNESSEQADHFLPVGMGVTSDQRLPVRMWGGIVGVLAHVLTLANDGVAGLQPLPLEIVETDFLVGFQSLSLSAGQLLAGSSSKRLEIEDKTTVSGLQSLRLSEDEAALIQTTAWDILIDGVSVKEKIYHASLEFSDSSIHNSIELQSIDRDLWKACDPDLNDLWGKERIVVQVGSRVIRFLLEERSGDFTNFSLWGRGLSGKDDTPYKETAEVEPTQDAASAMVASVLTESALAWSVADWVVPSGYTYSGSPIDCLQELASAVGAVARCLDDGSIVVRSLWPVRPVSMQAVSPDVIARKDLNIISVQYSLKRNEWYNAVRVDGRSTSGEDISASLEVDDPIAPDTALYRTEPATVRAFWSGLTPGGSPPSAVAFVTSGSASYLGMQTTVEEEDVVFIDGKGTTGKAVQSIASYEWIGSNRGTITPIKAGGTDLQCASGGYGLAKVSYNTQSGVYYLTGHDVEELLFVLVYSGGLEGASSSVLVSFVDTNSPEYREAEAINEPLLTNEASLIARGTAYLDEHCYDQLIATMEMTYDDAIVDGATIALDVDDVEVIGNFRISKVTIVFDGPQVKEVVEAIQCRV